jgi:hypothetical protein
VRFVHNGGAFVFDPFKLAAESAGVIDLREKRFGVVGLLELEAASGLDGRSEEIEEVLDFVGIAPADRVSGERFAENAVLNRDSLAR